MNETLKISAAGVIGLAVGLAVGFKVADKRQAAIYMDRLQAEEQSMRVYYEKVKKPYATPQEALAALNKEHEETPLDEEAPVPQDPREKAQKVQYNKIVKTEEYVPAEEHDEGAAAAEEFIKRNVFAEPDTTKPYSITQEEYMTNETGYSQVTLTFYEKGGVLTDDRDDIIEDKLMTVGEEFDQWFGVGSSDPNVAHVRNEKIGVEFEICRSEKSFEVDVLGEPDEG